MRRGAQFGLGLVALAIVGCAGVTHSMDMGGEDHGDMDHGGMNHGEMNHETMADPSSSMKHDGGAHHGQDHDGQDHDADGLTQTGHGHGGMNHGSLEIPEGQPVPQLNLVVEPDAMKGWNLQLETANFEFAPERVNQTSLVTEGHAHLFINGEKITRLYSPWYYIPVLPEGDHEVRVELNANGHERLTVEGQPIEATVQVTVSAP